MTPHFPHVGEVAAQLYRQSAGKEIDGVMVMDPYVVQALLEYTGPIQLTTVDRQLTSRNAAEYILRDQYLIDGDNATRIDALEEAASITFDTMLAGTLPDPTVLARDLGPLARERRLMVWTNRPDEQDLLRAVGILGEIPPVAGADGWSVAVTNAGGSKIDTYLQRAGDVQLLDRPGHRQYDGDDPRPAHQRRATERTARLRHRQCVRPARRDEPAARHLLQPPRPRSA